MIETVNTMTHNRNFKRDQKSTGRLLRSGIESISQSESNIAWPERVKGDYVGLGVPGLTYSPLFGYSFSYKF